MPTITDYKRNPTGSRQPLNLPVVGSRLLMAYARVTLVAADASSGTVTIRFPNMKRIVGFFITVLGAGNNVVGTGEIHTNTTGLDVTIGSGASENALTLADGTSGYDLTTGDVVHVLVVGSAIL